jgi:hypothetical protein
LLGITDSKEKRVNTKGAGLIASTRKVEQGKQKVEKGKMGGR